MTWDDDRWRDTYDAWKLRSPCDDDPEDECDHEEYEVDIVVGRAHCCKCSYSWWQTPEEIAAEHERIRQYDEWQCKQEKRARWEWITHAWRWFCYRAINRRPEGRIDTARALAR